MMNAQERVEKPYQPSVPEPLVLEERPVAAQVQPTMALPMHQLQKRLPLPVQAAIAGPSSAGLVAVERAEIRVRMPLAQQDRLDHLQQ